MIQTLSLDSGRARVALRTVSLRLCPIDRYRGIVVQASSGHCSPHYGTPSLLTHYLRSDCVHRLQTTIPRYLVTLRIVTIATTYVVERGRGARPRDPAHVCWVEDELSVAIHDVYVCVPDLDRIALHVNGP